MENAIDCDFRKELPSTVLTNQHSNGVLDFSSVSDVDLGRYVCRGQNRVGFTEEMLIIEYLGR